MGRTSPLKFQLILNPIRDWNKLLVDENQEVMLFQLILNPIRDWNLIQAFRSLRLQSFQLILNPIRDWNSSSGTIWSVDSGGSN